MSDSATPARSVRVPDELRALAANGAALRNALTELAARTPDAIALGRGDPDLDTPPHILAAANAAINAGKADVPMPPAGLPELRAAVANRLRTERGIPVDADGVLITCGGQEGLYLLMQGLLAPGDEILVPDPRYSSYDQAIAHSGATMVPIATEPEDGFDLRPEVVERAITPRTRAILLITPGNPTAGIISPPNLKAIAELARKHDLIVISDEIYDQLVYPPAEHLSIASLPGMFERTITLNGLSKSYAMTGWRVGYLAGPPAVIDVLTALKQKISARVAAPSQYAALAALTGPQDCVAEQRAIYLARRAIMLRGLDRLGLQYAPPHGAFYVFADAASVGISAFELSYLLLSEAKVLIFPGTAFGERWVNWLRISYLQPAPVLEEAIERMATVLERYS
jgi:aminotransferase